ncbi:hypothetical protein PEBR_26482 [Penicillium brasilianum]|uniref:Uncharacterized protein n=1 Tax=Penicillium brasilianum TaxID=104259 RepID=A0A1S9RIC8_PENBI|nr:hypothetical protein PEBR_26482 [Penicillium brasilianum]
MDLSLNDTLETLDYIIHSKETQDPATTVYRFHDSISTLVPESTRQQKRAESGEATDSGDQDGQADRFSNANLPNAIANSFSTTRPLAITSRSPSLFNGKPSIAAATVLGIITFAALAFLALWYIRHRRRRRQHKLLTQNQDFGQSEITLGEDTSKTLDDFLMKDVPHARTSLMFSRSRSPSITFVVDEAERPGPNKQGRNGYAPSSNSLTKLETLTRISTDGPQPSLLSSELTTSTTSQSTSANSSSKPASPDSTTPRASMSSSQLWTTITSSTDCPSTITPDPPSTAPPTTWSTQVWTSTTSSTETGSMTSRDNQSRLSNASRASSRLSAQGPPHGSARLSNVGSTSLRRYHARSGSRSSQNTVVLSPTTLSPTILSPTILSPTPESGSSGSGQLPSIPSTPSPLFRSSEEAV